MLFNACTPATPARYIKGTATDNFNVEKLARKSVELVQNSLKWRAEFASYTRRIFNFLAQNSVKVPNR